MLMLLINVRMTETEPLHVLITADTDEALARGMKAVETLLTPIDDPTGEVGCVRSRVHVHDYRTQIRKKELTELWKINGTLRETDDDYRTF